MVMELEEKRKKDFERDRNWKMERERKQDQQKELDRERYKELEREQARQKERDREQERQKERDREQARQKERDREHARQKEKENDKEQYRKKEKDNENMYQLVNISKSDQLSFYNNEKLIVEFLKKFDNLFENFVKDKCIALVGPAESIIGTGKGEVIDKFDLVVRLNKSIPLPKGMENDIGTRTDIIYNSLNTSDFPGENKLNTSLYKKHNVRFMCSSYPFNHSIFKNDILNYVHKYKFDIPFKVMNDLKFRNFENYLGTRPYTGTCAIMELLSYPIKYLYITGLDFYQTKYYSSYRIVTDSNLNHSRNSIIHNNKPQLEYLKNISLIDNRIILDDFLDKLLYNDYYIFCRNFNKLDINNIFLFGEPNFKSFFNLKISNLTFTLQNSLKSLDSDKIQLIFTTNRVFIKNNNQYIVFITNKKEELDNLNLNLEKKKYIANFYYKENKNNLSFASIYLSEYFISNIKNILRIVGINNCNVYLILLLAIILYEPQKNNFSKEEMMNGWKLTNNEKKLVLFLIKKKLIQIYE